MGVGISQYTRKRRGWCPAADITLVVFRFRGRGLGKIDNPKKSAKNVGQIKTDSDSSEDEKVKRKKRGKVLAQLLVENDSDPENVVKEAKKKSKNKPKKKKGQ